MDRREFVEACALSGGTLAATLAGSAWAADARPRSYGRVPLLDDLGKPAAATSLQTREKQRYEWPGGVGPRRSLVAFSAICAHKLVYPTKDLSFISFRKGAAVNPQTPSKGNDLIHCCADHSQYDPARGAQVLNGPAEQPLCAVLIEYDAKSDGLTAVGTLGGELFDDFFKKYEMKLSLEVGPNAKQAVARPAVVRELDQFCRNPVRC